MSHRTDPGIITEVDETAVRETLCECAPCVSLRRELTTIFGVPVAREGETWNDSMLRQIVGVMGGSVRQAEYVKHLHDAVTGPLDLLIKELKPRRRSVL